MFDVFLNYVPHGQGVLSVSIGLHADDLASPYFTLLNGNGTLSPSDMNLSKLLHASNGDVVKILVSPDDCPPRPPRLSLENTFQAPRPMADPDGDPPIKPK